MTVAGILGLLVLVRIFNDVLVGHNEVPQTGWLKLKKFVSQLLRHSSLKSRCFLTAGLRQFVLQNSLL